MTTTPSFASAVRSELGVVSAANTSLTGSGTIVDIFTAHATNGSRVDKITVNALATTVVGAVRIFRKRSGTYYFHKEIVVPVVTVAIGSQEPFRGILAEMTLLGPGEILAAATQIAATFNVHMQGGDF